MLDPDIPGYAEKLAKFGCSPEKAKAAKRDISKYECYLEYHIEQGDKLDHTGIDVGVVSRIVSIIDYKATVKGMKRCRP